MRACSLSLFVAALVLGVAGCSSAPPSDQAPLVRQAFDGFKDQVALGHAREALDYLDQPTRDYLQSAATRDPSGSGPEVDLVIRRAVQKLTPGGVGPDFDLAQPVQRLLDLGLVRPGDLAQLTLGPVHVDPPGRTAQAEAIWTGAPTTLQIHFQRDDSGSWKIDLLNLLPYASSALTMDRALKRETQDQQLDRLIGALPNP
jgi:hypothetical protein